MSASLHVQTCNALQVGLHHAAPRCTVVKNGAPRTCQKPIKLHRTAPSPFGGRCTVQWDGAAHGEGSKPICKKHRGAPGGLDHAAVCNSLQGR